MDEMIADTVAAEQPGPVSSKVQIFVGREGVVVKVPPGYWEDAVNDVVLTNGRTVRDQRIDTIALEIATRLRRLLKEQHEGSGLVGPDGQPL